MVRGDGVGRREAKSAEVGASWTLAFVDSSETAQGRPIKRATPLAVHTAALFFSRLRSSIPKLSEMT